jgi:bacillithiol system protein YtxJ
MKWVELKTEEQVDQIREESKLNPVLIFKHSRRCSISKTALDRLERNWKEDEMSHLKIYFLDLISFRAASDRIASQFDVEHESPQVLIIENGQSIYSQSHFNIDYTHILKASKS